MIDLYIAGPSNGFLHRWGAAIGACPGVQKATKVLG
jgi:hypothetical protein